MWIWSSVGNWVTYFVGESLPAVLASLSRKILNYYLFCNKKSNFLRKSESIKKSDESVEKKKPRIVERRSNGNKKRFSSFLEFSKLLKYDLLTLLLYVFDICDESNK